jgi:hypothetical protein
MMKTIISYAPSLSVVFVTAGLLIYSIALFLAAFVSGQPDSVGARLSAWFTNAPAQNLGLPCAGIAAFAIVAALLSAFPPALNASGQLELKAFSMEFSGPSGPITLWLMCFLGFVVAMKLLRV